METMILIAIGIFVGLIMASRALSRPTRGTIVIVPVPVEATEPSTGGLGCLSLIAVGVIILLFLSTN